MSRQSFISNNEPNRYRDTVFDVEAIKLMPGDYHAALRNTLLVTVLGSCISACIRDRVSGIGGMNHFMLPQSNLGRDVSGRYGMHAMEVLINGLIKLGAQREHLEAKLFGGGNVIASLTQRHIGAENARFAHDYLSTEGIPVIAQDLLDIYPRKVYFFSGTGKVLIKKLRRMHNDTLLVREAEYETQLSKSRLDGDVELFG